MGLLLCLLGFFLLASANSDLQVIGFVALIAGVVGDWDTTPDARKGGG